ncbi:dihydroorotase [Arthrospira platensis]|uniref:dihydroorotase n=2 Tax=Sirenicapillariaceae TaxID=2934961 RepID=UPI0001C38CE1|nr:dihydroorotase [Arthrospira platensis]AMW30150.1 dihydroorotase [Arthrospira platensis YZ]KDR54104.1 dihydroorotase [Arthrospira platensis str. Paraca]MBD2670109.1 dihydroorotase [Arthrospira platensis FACHB-439]MBD2709141.1 dihydroorotase [Arthrospira platensis FACHB-835]MDT9184344.1 dihydroorotase [Limnospira sp. PMC 289.06]MDT9296536.1 dihydroorotase [Arthrospira platensis PCC 7345]MDT9312149.1 dihydroorotase [Limnospira sp. Paracas R14]QQW28114.1 dihydroorotase [Arthrospira sp. PCC 9
MSTTPIIYIRRANILQPDGNFSLGDVKLGGGKILEISSELPAAGESETDLNAEGLTLLPGVIDPQVHFREPGLEYKEDLSTASRACAKGGVTSFLEMPNTRPLTSTKEALADKLERAAQKCLVNYGFFMGATPENLPDLLEANPTPGIKIFMGSMHGPLLVDHEEILEPIFAKGDRLIAVHAENQDRINRRREEFAGQTDPAIHSQIQDEQAALEATQLALKLSKKYQRRLHILHLSTGIEAELLRQDKPAWVTAEVTPQHLVLNITDYGKIGTKAQMNPPLRSPENNDVLWRALLDGVIDFIATDHAPHTLEEKAKPYPNSPSGMPGVETSLPVMLTQAIAVGRCSVAQVSNWMSTAVAKGYNIPNKGAIAPGYDADLVLVDLNNYRPVLASELQTKCGWSPFEGWQLTGWPVVTIVGGQVVYDHGKLNLEVRGKALTFDHQ